MHTVIRILLEQGDEGQVNYLPGTLQPHRDAPGHAQADCVCRATMNAGTPQSANGYMCRYTMRDCLPSDLCDNRRYLYDFERDQYDRKVCTLVDASTGRDVELPTLYPYEDVHDDGVQQWASVPSTDLFDGVRAGSTSAPLRYAPFELRYRRMDPTNDEYESLNSPNWGGTFALPH